MAPVATPPRGIKDAEASAPDRVGGFRARGRALPPPSSWGAVGAGRDVASLFKVRDISREINDRYGHVLLTPAVSLTYASKSYWSTYEAASRTISLYSTGRPSAV